MVDSSKVLIVEDERQIRELMALHLLRQGYKVVECGSVEEAMDAFQASEFFLVVLDWMLPGISGIELLDFIRKNHHDAAVLMVTAKTAPEDIVHGLERGADDYLTKPFEPSVFIARVKALSRRKSIGKLSKSAVKVEIDGLIIDNGTHQVYLNNERLHLTPSEYKLLTLMVETQGRVLTREQLIAKIQGEGISVVGRTIDTHVFGLRKKLKDWGNRIETIRGVGYRVNLEKA